MLVTAGGDPVEKVEVGGTDYNPHRHHHDHDHHHHHHHQVGAGQQLEIQQAAMPDQFDQMMEEVTRWFS